MKKGFIILILSIFGLCNQGYSQSFNFYNTSDTLTHANSIWMSVYSTGIIQNLSTTEVLKLDVIRLQIDNNPPWFSSICTDFCYPIFVDSTVLVLAPGQSQLFKNYFAFIQHNPDTAHARILFSDRMNPGTYFIRDYYCVDDSAAYYVGIPESESNNQLEIYPNPFSYETTLSFAKDLNGATLRMYNSSGQEVKEIAGLYGHSIQLYRDNLPNGIYFILLLNDNGTLTKKLILSDR